MTVGEPMVNEDMKCLLPCSRAFLRISVQFTLRVECQWAVSMVVAEHWVGKVGDLDLNLGSPPVCSCVHVAKLYCDVSGFFLAQ